MSEPPPSRYRIVEKDRRLTVIDTWTKDGTSTPAPTVRPPDSERAAGASGPDQSGPNQIGRGLLHRLALAASLGAHDPEGRPVFTTYLWFDARGPRSFALGRSGVRRLGSMILGLIVVAIIALILAVSADSAVWVAIIFFIAIFAGRGKPLFTRWADRFESLPDD